MDVFDGPHYRLIKFLLTCLGQWPYQKPLHRRIISTSLLLFVVSVFVPEILYLVSVWGNMNSMIDSGTAIAVELTNLAKFANYVGKADKVKVLMGRIRDDWQSTLFTASQYTILKKYADDSQKLMEFYSAYMYVTLAVYVISPFVPTFISFAVGGNESWPDIPFPIKYGNLDTQRYYIPMMVHCACTAFFVITVIVTMDTAYFVYIQHACGIFATIGDRLQRSIESYVHKEVDDPRGEGQEEAIYQEIVVCIKTHKEAIEFADTIESLHVVGFLFVMGLCIYATTFSEFQMLMHAGKSIEAFRLGMFVLAIIAHTFLLTWPGQRLIDHSERVQEWVYDVPWYEISDKSKRLLMLMMFRSVKPCTVTAGKLFVMCFVNFSVIVKSSASYLTLLISFQ